MHKSQDICDFAPGLDDAILGSFARSEPSSANVLYKLPDIFY